MQIKLLHLFEYSLLRGWGGHLFEYSLLRGYGGHLFKYSSMSRDIKLGSTVSAFIFLSTALTTPSNLGGCVTDYRTLHITLFHQHQHYPRIPRIPYITLFRLRISLPFYPVAYTFLMYIYHLISIDLQLSRLFNSYTLQSLHINIAVGSTFVGIGRFSSSRVKSLSFFLDRLIYCHTLLVLAVSYIIKNH